MINQIKEGENKMKLTKEEFDASIMEYFIYILDKAGFYDINLTLNKKEILEDYRNKIIKQLAKNPYCLPPTKQEKNRVDNGTYNKTADADYYDGAEIARVLLDIKTHKEAESILSREYNIQEYRKRMEKEKQEP